jgi:hypothetical protein
MCQYVLYGTSNFAPSVLKEFHACIFAYILNKIRKYIANRYSGDFREQSISSDLCQ